MKWLAGLLIIVSFSFFYSECYAQSEAQSEAESEVEETTVARDNIEGFHATLLSVMTMPLISEREAKLAPQIQTLFDMSRIAAVSLGRTWRTLSETQRSAFTDLLAQLIVTTYADRFDGFSGQQFVTNEAQAVKTGIVIRTQLLRESEAPVALDYYFRNGKVFNVVADGVSDLSLRRADYNSIVKNEGYAQLIMHMESKILQARGQL
jgi:phospholipid transport system substrate-binding protein